MPNSLIDAKTKITSGKFLGFHCFCVPGSRSKRRKSVHFHFQQIGQEVMTNLTQSIQQLAMFKKNEEARVGTEWARAHEKILRAQNFSRPTTSYEFSKWSTKTARGHCSMLSHSKEL